MYFSFASLNVKFSGFVPTALLKESFVAQILVASVVSFVIGSYSTLTYSLTPPVYLYGKCSISIILFEASKNYLFIESTNY